MDDNHLFRKLLMPAGRTIQAGYDTYLFFGGTAYLGLTQHTAFMELYIKGLQFCGINNGTSRNNNVQCGVYDEAETVAAARFGADAALILSSGFLAAQMTVKQLAGEGELLYAPGCHPALWLNNSPGVTGDWKEWVENTVRSINDSADKNFVVVCNTLNNLQPERYDLSLFNNIREDKQVHFLLDHSHGIGILPDDPKNIRDFVPNRKNFRVTIVASLAKGMGVDAGLVLSDQTTIATLKQSPVFLGASPPAPAAIYAFMHAADIYRQEFITLQQNIRWFQQNIRSHCEYIEGFPVFYFPENNLYDRLLAKKIVISSFPYPLPSSPLLNRVVISSAHTREDIDTLIHAIDNPE